MNALVSLQGGRLGELFVADGAAVGLVAGVAHAVAQQTLRVGEGLGAHLHRHNQQARQSHLGHFKSN